jgi:hypothetical protein
VSRKRSRALAQDQSARPSRVHGRTERPNAGWGCAKERSLITSSCSMRITCADSFATMSATTTRNACTLDFKIRPRVALLNPGRHRLPKSWDFRASVVFTIATCGKKRRSESAIATIRSRGDAADELLRTDRQLRNVRIRYPCSSSTLRALFGRRLDHQNRRRWVTTRLGVRPPKDSRRSLRHIAHKDQSRCTRPRHPACSEAGRCRG